MKQRRHTPDQVIRKLREADRLLAEGRSTAEVAKALEVSEQTFHRWRHQYGGMKADDAKRLRELEKENIRLKADRRRPGPGHSGAEGGRGGKSLSPTPPDAP